MALVSKYIQWTVRGLYSLSRELFSRRRCNTTQHNTTTPLSTKS